MESLLPEHFRGIDYVQSAVREAPMTHPIDQTCLQTDQYKDSSNFNARLQIHERFSTNPYGWHRWVFEQLDLPAKSHILELGCGPGDLWLKNSHRIPEGWSITLSDFSPGMVEEAQVRLAGSDHSFVFAVFDAQCVPFAAESFDGVIANHMLYHVPSVQKALCEIRRVLRPGGHLYAATNGCDHLRELEELCGKFDPEGYREALDTIGGLLTDRGFSLENGHQLLSPWYSQVHVRRYKDGLVITKVEPLLAWGRSWAQAFFPGDKFTAFLQFLEQEMIAQGAIRVTKDPGLFVAL